MEAIRELLDDQVTGLLIQNQDFKMLADHIALLSADFQTKKRLRINARARIEDEFNAEINITRLERALRFVLGSQQVCN